MALPEFMAVYQLRDPRDGRVRYIGSSSRPKKRLREHMAQRNTMCRRQYREWFQSLHNDGLLPQLEVLTRMMPKHDAIRLELLLQRLYHEHYPLQIVNGVVHGYLRRRPEYFREYVPQRYWSRYEP